MSEYRFHLQKYKMGSKTTCPSCGRIRCFTRYIDDAEEIHFPDNVGLCDHVNSCGYHYPPKDYFRDNGSDSRPSNDWKQCVKHMNPAIRQAETSFIGSGIMEKSLSHYAINPLYGYLSSVFGEDETKKLFEEYQVGTSSKWGGATVYWQIDLKGRIRTGKIMLYDVKTGHRVKEPTAYVSWVHSRLGLQNFCLKQCFFGEHLLAKYPDEHVVIVESEKTAIIGRHFLPNYIWIATGGKNGCFNSSAIEALYSRNVILIPDLGATQSWKEKLPLLTPICKSVTISDVIEKLATEEQRSHGLDIADFLLMEDTPQAVLQKMIAKNPCLQKLIDTFKLELIE